MMFTELKDVGVAPKHLSKLLGINRVTASNWINGHAAPHPMLDKKAAAVLKAIEAAAEAKELPPPKDYKGLERDLYVVKTILTHHEAQKARP